MKQESHESAGAGSKREISLMGDFTVGEILLNARDRAGLTLEEASEKTRIHRKMLSYLETDNFEAIPAKVYVKGFLRTYAELLGLDAKHVLSKYEVQTGQTHTSKGDHWEIEADVVEEKLEPPRLAKWIAIPAVIAIIAAVLVIWSVRRERPISRPPSESSVLEEVQRRGDTSDGGVAVDSLRPEAIKAEEEPTVDDGRGETAVESPRAVEPVSSLQLELIAYPSESTWFDLLTVSIGARPETTAYEFVLFPGEVKRFDATDAFILRRVGNAGGFTMKLNGVSLPPLGARSEIKRGVVITRKDLPSGE